MRNLKRALSLALASVMLLGMMVIGTSAATFTDADEIVNTEAATITAGLGLFAGSEGKFNPAGTVTRAQMATVIVKMLYGSEINADSYKGSGKFSDVASFEGGWAEGYINLCANLGIVGGYGDGTFKPGQALTTAEAVTMLLNALKVDAGEGTWPITVMAAAEKIELYKDMETAKPTTNEALTRDQLSALVWNAVKYSPEGGNTYTVDGATYDDAVIAYLIATQKGVDVQVNPAKDTLAVEVFDLKTAAGIVTYNQATTTDAYTTVEIETEDGPVDLLLDVETGLDLIGHEVVAYYAEKYNNEKNPGVAYAVVDQNTTVVVAQPNGGIDSRSEYRAAFGSTKAIEPADSIVYYRNYTADSADAEEYLTEGLDCAEFEVPNGIYVLNEENEIVAFHMSSEVHISEVLKVNTTAGKETIKFLGIEGNDALNNNEEEDVVVEYAGIADEDLVAVTAQGALYVVEKLDAVVASISSKGTNKDNEMPMVTANGTTYTQGTFTNHSDIEMDVADNDKVKFDKEYTIYLYNGKLVGMGDVDAAVDTSNVIFVVDIYSTEKDNGYANDTSYTYAQGVDMTGKEVNILINVREDYEADDDYTAVLSDEAEALVLADEDLETNRFYTFEKCGESKGNKYGIMTATACADDEDLIETELAYANGDIDKITATSKRVNTEDGTVYTSAASKMIKVSGDGATLESTLSETLNYKVKDGNDDTKAVLVSVAEDGTKTLEVIVIVAEKLVSADDVLFVTADQLDDFSAIKDAIVYSVYNAKTGEIVEDLPFSAELTEGFSVYSYNETDKVYEVETADDLQVGEAEGYYTGLYFNSTVNGMITLGNMDDIDDDEYDVVIDDYDASNVKIVDTRSEDTCDSDGVSAITTLAELKFAASEKGFNAAIEVSAVTTDADADDAEVFVIYITDVTVRPDEV